MSNEQWAMNNEQLGGSVAVNFMVCCDLIQNSKFKIQNSLQVLLS